MTDSTTSTDTDVSTAVEDTEDGTGLDTEAHHFDDGAAGHAAVWRSEVIGGGAMVGIVVLVALFFRWRPGPTFVDHWGFSLVHADIGSSFWMHVTDIRSTSTLVAGSILAALVVVLRDHWRALACLVAPTLAVLLTEFVLKPVIARRFEFVLTFPSGSVTAVAAVATAWVLAVPRWLRFPVVVIGAFVVGLECIAIIALQWHYPSDALGGVLVGVGVVLLADGLLHVVVAAVRGHFTGNPTDGTTSDPTSDPTHAPDGEPSASSGLPTATT